MCRHQERGQELIAQLFPMAPLPTSSVVSGGLPSKLVLEMVTSYPLLLATQVLDFRACSGVVVVVGGELSCVCCRESLGFSTMLFRK